MDDIIQSTERYANKDEKNIEQFHWWDKQVFSLTEASQYFGISDKKFREMASANSDLKWILMSGCKLMVKKNVFQRYLDEELSVI